MTETVVKPASLQEAIALGLGEYSDETGRYVLAESSEYDFYWVFAQQVIVDGVITHSYGVCGNQMVSLKTDTPGDTHTEDDEGFCSVPGCGWVWQDESHYEYICESCWLSGKAEYDCKHTNNPKDLSWWSPPQWI